MSISLTYFIGLINVIWINLIQCMSSLAKIWVRIIMKHLRNIFNRRSQLPIRFPMRLMILYYIVQSLSLFAWTICLQRMVKRFRNIVFKIYQISFSCFVAIEETNLSHLHLLHYVGCNFFGAINDVTLSKHHQ